MALERFSLATLATMDGGRIKEAFEQLLTQARLDCEDRPNLDGARTVTLKVLLEPIAADTGELQSIDVSCELGIGMPKRSSKTYNMEAVAGALLFNELSPDEIKQKTLDMAPKPSTQREGSSRKDRTGEEVSDVG